MIATPGPGNGAGADARRRYALVATVRTSADREVAMTSAARALSVRPLLTVEEVARLLGVSRTQAYRLVDSGDLPVVRVGSRIKRVRPESVEQFLDRHGVAARGTTQTSIALESSQRGLDPAPHT